MSLTVKQLNGDASFLLTFEPIGGSATLQEPFRILLDPWITGPCKVLHHKISSTTHVLPACVSSLQQLPEPDLVIISQNRSDHCNEATLRQLPATSTKTFILAEPSAARTIRSWNYFDEDMVKTLPRWENPRQTGRETVTRIAISPMWFGGGPGEVTISLISEKRGLKGAHSAIGITYRPPPSQPLTYRRPTLTPPTTPKSAVSTLAPQLPPQQFPITDPADLPPPPSIFSDLTPPASPALRYMRSDRSIASLSRHTLERSLSVIFSPHGTQYSTLEPFVTSHLLSEAALPLTALLHCFDAVSHPWWLGGNVSTGMLPGQETASKFGARAWISTHDGEKTINGLVARITRRRRHRQQEVRNKMDEVEKFASREMVAGQYKKASKSTEVMALAAGEEVTLTSEGIWQTKPNEALILSPLCTQRSFDGFLSLKQHWTVSTEQTA